MICSQCGSANEAGCRFCTECGLPLAVVCPSCASANRPGAKFCGSCGAVLAPADPTDVPARVEAPAGDTAGAAQRRVVSVLFADLVGFTTISQHRDAEDVRDLLTRYFETARTTVE